LSDVGLYYMTLGSLWTFMWCGCNNSCYVDNDDYSRTIFIRGLY